MHTGRMVFSQLMDVVSMQDFRSCVVRYGGEWRVRRFSCWDQFLCMVFAQLTHRESLRDIELSLRAVQRNLYHAGIRARVARNTLANANRHRDWRIWQDLALGLIDQARALYAGDPLAVDLAGTVYAFDSTMIDLCLTLFPWAPFERSRGAVKLHTMLDLRGNIPTMCVITHGRVHDVTVLDWIPFEPGAIYVLDRGYVSYARLWRIQQARAGFVIRAQRNLKATVVATHPVDSATGVLEDQTIVLAIPHSRSRYPDQLRRICYHDRENDRTLTYLSNLFTLPARTIADLYRERWQIECFFKWIKQHLRIKRFYGTNKNAVKTQIWIAITTYLLVAILKKQLQLEPSPYQILQILGISLFERVPIKQLFSNKHATLFTDHDSNQLSFLNF